MLEQSTCLNCRTYQGKHNGTVVLTYERRTKQLYWEQILHQTTTVTLGALRVNKQINYYYAPHPKTLTSQRFHECIDKLYTWMGMEALLQWQMLAYTHHPMHKEKWKIMDTCVPDEDRNGVLLTCAWHILWNNKECGQIWKHFLLCEEQNKFCLGVPKCGWWNLKFQYSYRMYAIEMFKYQGIGFKIPSNRFGEVLGTHK